MSAYYNEIDPFAAQWLRELIKAGHIAPGDVDERSIEDVRPEDLRGYTQCHFFAGIGVWSYALRKAGWPDDRPVWTGSCPCQPFSTAGKGKGASDDRHLWPAMLHLIQHSKPNIWIGEQVASRAVVGKPSGEGIETLWQADLEICHLLSIIEDADLRGALRRRQLEIRARLERKNSFSWIDAVQNDMEGAGYYGGAIDMCAAGVGAPHIRQRLWIGFKRLGNDSGKGLPERIGDRRIQREALEPCQRETIECGSDTGRLADANQERQERLGRRGKGGITEYCQTGRPLEVNGFWRDSDWISCRDGRLRPVRPGSFPLVNGAPARVGRLCGYGNAINAEAAKTFIEAFSEVIGYNHQQLHTTPVTAQASAP